MMKPIIDISFWQTPLQINYDVLAEAVSGVILRAAYGTGKDIHFEQHYAEFVARDVPVGAYHYIIGSQNIKAQADNFNSFTAGKELKLGRWMDVEDTRNVTRLYRRHVLEYADYVKDAGIYTGKWKWQEIMGGAYLTDRKLWIAAYGYDEPPLPVGWNSYWLWQYSSTLRLPGYSGNLDHNRFYGTQEQFDAWVGNEEPEPEPEPEPLFQARVYSWATPYVNVRAQPSVQSPKRGVKRPLVVVDVYEVLPDWYKIKEGYMMSRFLERLDTQEPPSLMAVPLYSQRDSRWANDLMGSSGITLGAEGCLVTCTAAGLTYLGYEIDPKEYNRLASTRGGYQSPNFMYWMFPDVITNNFIKRHEYRWISGGVGWEQYADPILADKRPVWAQVDFVPGGAMNQHWVLIIGKVGGVYWIFDPWYGAVSRLDERYSGVYRIVSYRRI